MAVIYELDGIDLREYGIHVSKSSGIVGRPNVKSRRSVSYADEDGEYVDLQKCRYEKRDITLECSIVGDQDEVVGHYNQFIAVLHNPGTHRVKVVTSDGSKPLVFEVYLNDNTYATPYWCQGDNVMTFSVKLTEAKPLKRVYEVSTTPDSGESVSIHIVTGGAVDIHWGDNTHTLDVSGERDVTHTYQGEGRDVIVVMSGNVEDITSVQFNTDNELIWGII